ncbi:MAG: hypothetical protein NW220_21780 [Leptolyngbyaceae cyanobacterium bins.349]|nr:hypothetical protein [Leptolyngbyaceae cyanobacterium bins.349]
MLLQNQLADTTEGTIYFSIPGQDDYLYEYEGDLDEVLDALPEIYEATDSRVQTLTSEAAIVLDQLWEYFDRTGEQHLEGQHEYNFEVEGDPSRVTQSARLLVLPKDNSGEVVAIDRNGQIESSFETGRFEHLMERFAIAYQQIQLAQAQEKESQEWERG